MHGREDRRPAPIVRDQVGTPGSDGNSTGTGPGRRRRGPGPHLHQAGPDRRVSAVCQPGRTRRGNAVLPVPHRADQPGAGRDPDV